MDKRRSLLFHKSAWDREIAEQSACLGGRSSLVLSGHCIEDQEARGLSQPRAMTVVPPP